MADIIRKFNVPTYGASTIYDKYDVVKVTSSSKEYYFVSTVDGNRSNLNTTNRLSNTYWKRFDDVAIDFADVWTPSYSTSAETEPRVVNARMEDGVTSLARDGINTTPLRYNLAFDNIRDREAKSLLCFFDFVGAKRSFKWTVPPPYEKQLSFTFVNLSHMFSKKDNNSISINIEQSFVIYGVGAGQQSFGSFES